MRCSGCRLVFYCSQEHQKSDWKNHKLQCNHNKVSKKTQDTVQADALKVDNLDSSGVLVATSADAPGSEKRECRCMFCGETLLLESEEAAIAHMTECPALQEQLASKDQFTIPKIIQEKMDKSDKSAPHS